MNERFLKSKELNEIRKFYGKKYKRIFDVLEKRNATDFEVDKECGMWLELWCKIREHKIKLNIGIDDKYHVWYDANRIGSYKTQSELILILYSL